MFIFNGKQFCSDQLPCLCVENHAVQDEVRLTRFSPTVDCTATDGGIKALFCQNLIQWGSVSSSIVELVDLRSYCSDITNTLVGISGETVPEGGNLYIY